MSQVEVRQRIREQQAKQKEIVLKYRGVAYIVKRTIKNWIKKKGVRISPNPLHPSNKI